ncbi:MAG: primosomal protein N' [Chloroflexi bacterium]|nr:primosomal protein N' [Chloroflexota bacterium]
MNRAPFAEVVVNSPASRSAPSFHYGIPPGMSLAIGQLVWVPFGPRRLQGIVLDLLFTSDVDGVRNILDVADPLPVLNTAQVALARWIADYYCSSLLDATLLMLPSGLRRKCFATVESQCDNQSTGPLTENQYRLLAFLRTAGRMRVDKVKSALGIRGLDAAVRILARRGLLVRGWELEKPRVKPRLEKQIRLAFETSQLEAALDRVRSAPKQMDLLSFLHGKMSSGDTTIPLAKLYAETGCTPQVVNALSNKGLIVIQEQEVWREPAVRRVVAATPPTKLTPEQDQAWQMIRAAMHASSSSVFLLHGVTGSGKTEIYLQGIREALGAGKHAIVLVPEIALTPQTVHRFASRFPGQVGVLHSRLTPGEHYDEWRRIRDGHFGVIVGSRSAVFAPLHRPGLIVVDEEHEWSYKQEKMPRYHTRDVAVKLGELTGATVILGSATPDLTTYHRATMGQYRLLELFERVEGEGAWGYEHDGDTETRRGSDEGRDPHPNPLPEGEGTASSLTLPLQGEGTSPLPLGEGEGEGAPRGEDTPRGALMPPVHIVDLRQELRSGNRSVFSRALAESITLALSAHEQVILYLNRRGSSTFVMCRDCGHVLKCKRCDVPLVYHSAEDDLVCHQCNFRTFAPEGCPACWGSRIRFFGTGTEKLEEDTKKRFPQARVLRWDSDVTKGRQSHEEILRRFVQREADILIGTQMVAKGLDLPLVTLVGVISADTALHLPDFRAVERTFQLLMQVSGRAGRGVLGGRVIVQSYSPDHYCIQTASRHDYRDFYRQEMEFRREHFYPPFGQLVKLVRQHSNDAACQHDAEKLSLILKQSLARLGLPATDVVGPAPAYLRRIRGKFRWQILLRGTHAHELVKTITIPLGWVVDVEPISTL